MGEADGFDMALLGEKDRVIREVRKAFTGCASKISDIENLVGLGSVAMDNPSPNSAPGGLGYGETAYVAGLR